MSNPEGPDQANEPAVESEDQPDAGAAEDTADAQDGDAEVDAPETEVMAVEEPESPPAPTEPTEPAVPRYTAPSGFDSSTQKIESPPDPATEILPWSDAPGSLAAAGAATEPFTAQGKPVAPQVIPGRTEATKPPGSRRSWGWVIALILVIAALVAVAILGTVLLTRNSDSKASQEDLVRTTIQNFDVAVQKGDLATLRSITCGATRDAYVNYDDKAWTETHARVAAAKQYPVVASIDQVVVNGDHAEANVTTFMAYAPQTRSTRSFDLQFRDHQWKICQAPK